MNDDVCTDSTSTVQYSRKDFSLTVRINRGKWELFRGKCNNIHLSASELINAFIDGFLSGQLNEQGKSTQLNLNMNLIQNQQSQSMLEPKVDIKEYVTETELLNWVSLADKQLASGREPAPLVKRKIIELATRLKHPKKEHLNEIKKLMEFNHL